ncbi:MAG: DUF3153 domain-containing protein [Geitlerinemataceae cyanobacterium]
MRSKIDEAIGYLTDSRTANQAEQKELTPDMLKSALPVMPTPANRRSWGQTIRGLAVVLLASLCLSGCVRYDVGVTFDSQTHGEIVQQIRLSQQLTNFSGATVEEWLDSIDSRARRLQGKTKRSSDRELTVKIPFNNGAQLVEKFNGFFNPAALEKGQVKTTPTAELPQWGANLSLKQNNAFLALRNRLSVDLDLRGLGAIADAGDTVEIGAGSLFEIDFALNTPWGATTVVGAENTLQAEQSDRHLVWKLKPGQMNHFEAVFWVPSPIGIGSIVIVFLMVAGHLLKHRLFPALGWERKPKKRKQLIVNS